MWVARPHSRRGGTKSNGKTELKFDEPELRFTGKKVYLLEWVLWIHLSGCLNDGKLTFKDTIERFQEFLHIDLGDYDVGIQEMARRKISVTKFTDFVLEKLKEKLGNMG
jgi:hypothetical protein